MPTREALVRKFFDAINPGDRADCAALLADDCRYVDAQGEILNGVEACANLAMGLRLIDPGVRIEIESAVRRNNDVLVRGTVHCTDRRFSGETMWRVTLAADRITDIQAHAGRFGSVVKTVSGLDPTLGLTD